MKKNYSKKFVNSGYSEGGASQQKHTLKTYNPRHYSSKLDLDYNLNTLRNRAADLVINSPIGAAAMNVMQAGTLSTGLQVFPQGGDRDWNLKTKAEFENWANSLDCDFMRRNSFMELQRIAFLSYLTDGDCFCLFRRRAPTRDFPYTLKLQLLESQRVSTPNGLTESTNGDNKIINGIEVDKSGRMVAIWVSNKIWNEPLTLTPELKWQRVKWYGEHHYHNILHICFDTRTEQFRGAPLLAPVIESLKMLLRYSEAELTAAVIRSFFSLFFVQLSSSLDLNTILPGEPVLDVDNYSLGSGTLAALPRGVDVRTVSNNNVSTFDSFTKSFITQISAGIGIPYEVLMQHFQSSYSASRAALIQAEQTFKQRRAAFVNDFCRPVYEMWLNEAVSTGRIEAPGYFENPTKYNRADWRTAHRESLDPVKDVTAAAKRIELGISTREIESVNIGSDFYSNIEQLKTESQLMQEIEIGSAATSTGDSAQAKAEKQNDRDL